MEFDEEFISIFGNCEEYKLFKSNIIPNLKIVECSHPEKIELENIVCCKVCGSEIVELDFQQEWKTYGLGNEKSRCNGSKENTKGRIDDVFINAKLNLPASIKNKVAAKYNKIVGSETVRGKGRKSIVAACLLHTYREEGDTRTADDIRELFDLQKKDMSTGIRKYLEVFRETRTKDVSHASLIPRYMKMTGIDVKYYRHIIRISNCLDRASIMLNRSGTQSVTSAIIYFYLCINRKLKARLGYTKIKFAQKVNISDITITKLVKEIVSILKLSPEIGV